MSVNAEKAFNRVIWCFFKETVKQWGIGPLLLEKIIALYHNPTARIRTNGALSDPVTISNGTQKGCPLSPLLYLLVMEHLTIEHKMSVYADDLLLYITNPVVTIPNLIQDFIRYGILSNFKVNYDKSEVLNIGGVACAHTKIELGAPSDRPANSDERAHIPQHPAP